jgi:pimeloyl-ACP methyl ester carboxylesterase
MFARNGEYELFYETDGDPSGRPLLLVNGFTRQCIGWRQPLVDAWVDAGFFAVRFDNREVGLSTKSAPGTQYTISAMASDAVAVLDAAGVERADVWGMSMGGMIAQTLAIEHPERVASLTSVMSAPGDGSSGGSTPEALEALMTPAPEERAACIEHRVRTARVICGPHFDEAWERRRAGEEYDRCFHPAGALVQMTAIRTSGDRTARLRRLTVPTTVIHGRVDPLIQVSGGEATAAAIPDARLVVFDEMGHDLPEVYWPTYVRELVAVADRADARAV